MSRFVSALKRFSDNDMVRDLCAFAAMGAFLAGAFYGTAAASAAVAAWRLGL